MAPVPKIQRGDDEALDGEHRRNLVRQRQTRLSSQALRLLPLALAGAFLVGLGLFAYFASVVDNFPGELRVSRWVQSWRTPWLDTVMRGISTSGLLAVVGPVVLLASAALYLRGRRAEGLMLLATAGVGRIVALGVKALVARPRPSDDLVQVLQEGDGYSFPSGHVMYYVVFLGTLAFLLAWGRGPAPALRLVQAALVGVTLAIGVSRIYLGVHWLGDVVASYALGAAVVAGAAWLWSRWLRRRRGTASPP